MQEVAGLIKTFKRSRDMMKSLSGGAMGGLKSLMSGKLDMFGAMSGGAKKVKQRSKRKRQPRKKKKQRR